MIAGCLGFLTALGSSASALHAAEPRTIVFFGDSLTAGYGLEEPATESYPGLIQQKIDTVRLPWRFVNAGLSGETTSGGARRIAWILRQPIDVFVLARGGNDGLRGIEPGISRASLQRIIDRVREKYPNAQRVIAGMMMAPSLGADYVSEFAAMYSALAKKNATALIPFLLEGVGGELTHNQPDQIHPTARGQAMVAETVRRVIQPLLTP